MRVVEEWRLPFADEHYFRAVLLWNRMCSRAKSKELYTGSRQTFFLPWLHAYLGWPQVVAVVAVPSRQKWPSGQGWSALSTPVTSHTRPEGHTRGTGMPSSGQWKPTGQRKHALLPRLGWYVPSGHRVKFLFDSPGQKVPWAIFVWKWR